MFIGESLINIRILNELSRSELAKKLDITEQAVWQYENGYVTPKLDIINKMKSLFKVKSGYFLKDDLIEQKHFNNIKIERIAYRSEFMNTAIKTQSELIHVKFLDALLKKVTKKITFPKNEIMILRDQVLEFLNKSDSHMQRSQQISYVAKIARKRLGLPIDNNKNLVFYLEKAGAFIIEKSIGDTIDAYSVWSEDDTPYIILGNIKKSAVRRNFDLAHELGHLLLHYKTEFNMLDRENYKLKEEEANTFASEFLMPATPFSEDISTLTRVSNPKSYLELKKKWLVSIQAMGLRVRSLDLMSYQQLRYFFISINKYGYKKREPLDDKIPIDKPMKIKSIFKLLFEKEVLTLQGLMDEIKVDLEFLSMITGIETAFFEKYLIDQFQSFSIDDLKIVE